MLEIKGNPELFAASIEGIKSSLNKAVGITGLPSTRGLCHYINYSIAMKLKSDFGMPIKEYGLGAGNIFSNDVPAIGYVAYAHLDYGKSIVEHSYLMVFGVEKSPILIDGANDQLDPSTPFFVSHFSKSDYSSVSYFLKKLKRPIRELTFKERNNGTLTRDLLFKYLQEMSSKGIIREEEAMAVISQRDIESQAGLNFLFFGLSRDWLTYFSKSLGINYPSLQYLQEAFYKYIKDKGIRFDKLLKEPESKQMIDEAMLRLKQEGMV